MRVPRLVDVELAAAGQRHFGEHAPALILHRSAVDPALLHLREESADVVAHEKERVAGDLRLVHRDFSRRQAKDYVAAIIDARQLEHVAEESEVGLRFRAADDAMRADEHKELLLFGTPVTSSGGYSQVHLVSRGDARLRSVQR